jgi:hypothetical protein
MTFPTGRNLAKRHRSLVITSIQLCKLLEEDGAPTLAREIDSISKDGPGLIEKFIAIGEGALSQAAEIAPSITVFSWIFENADRNDLKILALHRVMIALDVLFKAGAADTARSYIDGDAKGIFIQFLRGELPGLLNLADRAQIISSIIYFIGMANTRSGIDIATAAAPYFQDVIAGKPLDESSFWFSTMWNTIWSVASSPLELLPLDKINSAAAERARILLPTAIPTTPIGSGIAYVLFNADETYSVHTWVQLHARIRPNDRIHVYVLKGENPSLRRFYESSPVTVRFFDLSQQPIDRYITSMKRQFSDDQVDVMLTDGSFFINVCLLAIRTAPIQCVIDITHAYGNIPEVDWWYIGSSDYRLLLGLPPVNCAIYPFVRALASIPSPEPATTTALKSTWPKGTFYFGIICRLCKIQEELLAIATSLLSAAANAVLVICGEGDAQLINGWLDAQTFRDRIVFVNQSIDINVYGASLDVFLDTFPFMGGMVCIEVQSYGVPVVAKNSVLFPNFLEGARDPDLVAIDNEDYVRLALKLYNDPSFMAAKSAAARAMAERADDAGRVVLPIIAEIERLRLNYSP